MESASAAARLALTAHFTSTEAEDYEEHKRHVESVSCDPWETQIEIKFTCTAYLPLLGTKMVEHLFGVLLPAQKKNSCLLKSPSY